MKNQFSTSRKDLENIGIHITKEQYSDLCEINLFMKGMPDIPVYSILLVLISEGYKNGKSINPVSSDRRYVTVLAVLEI